MDFSPSLLEYTIECRDGEEWECRQLFDVLLPLCFDVFP